MRTIGFLLVVVGGLLAYLGLQGKVGQAVQALKTGSVPSIVPAPSSGIVVPKITPATPNGSFHSATSGNFTITPPIPPQGNGW